MSRLAVLAPFALAVAACAGPGLSPPQITGEQQADLAVREFLFAGERLAHMFGFAMSFEQNAAQTTILNRNANSFLGYQLKADIPYAVTISFESDADPFRKLNTPEGVVNHYIKTGYYASSILCRNYLSGLRDRNEYFEFLQRELGVAGTLTTTILALSHASGAVSNAVNTGLQYVNQGLNNYEEFRFLAPDIETIMPIVMLAQSTLRDHYVGAGRPTTFAGAINAVNNIEFQCTRSGIRKLLNKTLVQAPPVFTVTDGVLFATGNKQLPEKPQSK